MVVFVDELDGVGVGFADRNDGLPDRGSCFAVVDHVLGSGRCLPSDRGVVGLIAFYLDFFWRVARLSQSCHDSKVRGGNAGQIIEVNLVDGVIGGVLMGEFFVDFDISNGIEPGICKWCVVASPTESVAAEDELGAEFGLGFADDEFGEPGEFAGVVSFGFFGEDADTLIILLSAEVGG